MKYDSSQEYESYRLKGLAHCLCLPQESPKGFEETVAEFMKRYVPADAVERGFVEEMISAHWRLRRTWAMETNTVDRALKMQPYEPTLDTWGAAARVLASSPEFALINRYESRLQATYQRALNNLIRTRKAFLRTEPDTAAAPAPKPLQEPPEPPKIVQTPPVEPEPEPATTQIAPDGSPDRPDYLDPGLPKRPN